jgi:5-methylcytosine-specific restriction protein A
VRACLDCGALAEGTRCAGCQTRYNRRRLATPAQRQIRNSRAWRRTSREHLRQHPLCVDCQAEGRVQLATDVHHEHARGVGGPLLGAVLTSVCKRHHGQRTQAERRGEATPTPTPPSPAPEPLVG